MGNVWKEVEISVFQKEKKYFLTRKSEVEHARLCMCVWLMRLYVHIKVCVRVFFVRVRFSSVRHFR